MIQTTEQAAAELIRAKARRRRELADLPFERKIEIVVELQRIAFEMAAAGGRIARKPWNVRR